MPTEEKPLILVLEEFDILINKIHHNLIQMHKHIPIQVKDKTSWNTLFDRIDRGLYPNLIVLLTSNVNPEYVDNLDKSYLRQGRVNNRYHLKSQ
jgi:Cdc6-like AAA superfamily ATPase